jgi:hypothetical protein
MLGPIAATFIDGASHIDESMMKALHGADGLVVLGGGGTKVDASLGVNLFTQAARQVGPVVGDDATRRAMATDDVFHKDV